jgi:hypothetical protein
MSFDVESQPGILPPTGFWDPLNLARDIDEETFIKYRTAELKHGRVAQLAVVGLLSASASRFPGSIGDVNFADIPNSLEALNVVPGAGWAQIGASIGFWEIYGWQQKGSTPGDFGFQGSVVFKSDEEELKAKNQELQHGRLAMIGIAELLAHNLAQPTKDIFDLNFY